MQLPKITHEKNTNRCISNIFVPKTDTGILDEKSKVIRSMDVKEFGKMAP